MIAAGPYPHPFLFMTDFRQHILDFISEDSRKRCQNTRVSVPDMFTLISYKVSAVYDALVFYSPVMESLGSDLWLWRCIFPIFITSLLVFLLIGLPLMNLLYLFLFGAGQIEVEKEVNGIYKQPMVSY